MGQRSGDVFSLGQFLSSDADVFVKLPSFFRRPDEPEQEAPDGLLSLSLSPHHVRLARPPLLSVSDDAKERKTETNGQARFLGDE